MDSFFNRFKNAIKGTITGFDRIVFKGYHRAISHAAGAMNFLRFKNILNKNFKEWTLEPSAAIVDSANRFSIAESGRLIEYLNSSNLRRNSGDAILITLLFCDVPRQSGSLRPCRAFHADRLPQDAETVKPVSGIASPVFFADPRKHLTLRPVRGTLALVMPSK